MPYAISMDDQRFIGTIDPKSMRKNKVPKVSDVSIRMRIFLTGAYQGKTINLGKFSFKDGCCEVCGPSRDVANLIRFAEVNWQAYPEGDQRLEGLYGTNKIHPKKIKDSDETVSSGLQQFDDTSEEEETTECDGYGHGETRQSERLANGDRLERTVPVNSKLKNVILSLDHSNDDHWTPTGKPALAAIEQALGASGITRKQIEHAVPGFKRQGVDNE